MVAPLSIAGNNLHRLWLPRLGAVDCYPRQFSKRECWASTCHGRSSVAQLQLDILWITAKWGVKAVGVGAATSSCPRQKQTKNHLPLSLTPSSAGRWHIPCVTQCIYFLNAFVVPLWKLLRVLVSKFECYELAPGDGSLGNCVHITVCSFPFMIFFFLQKKYCFHDILFHSR